MVKKITQHKDKYAQQHLLWHLSHKTQQASTNQRTSPKEYGLQTLCCCIRTLPFIESYTDIFHKTSNVFLTTRGIHAKHTKGTFILHTLRYAICNGKALLFY